MYIIFFHLILILISILIFYSFLFIYILIFIFLFLLIYIVTVGFRGPPENPDECVPGAKMVENSLGKLSEVVINAMGLVATPLRSQLADLMTGTLTALVNVNFIFIFIFILF